MAKRVRAVAVGYEFRWRWAAGERERPAESQAQPTEGGLPLALRPPIKCVPVNFVGRPLGGLPLHPQRIHEGREARCSPGLPFGNGICRNGDSKMVWEQRRGRSGATMVRNSVGAPSSHLGTRADIQSLPRDGSGTQRPVRRPRPLLQSVARSYMGPRGATAILCGLRGPGPWHRNPQLPPRTCRLAMPSHASMKSGLGLLDNRTRCTNNTRHAPKVPPSAPAEGQ